MSANSNPLTCCVSQEEEELSTARASIALNRKQQKNLDFERIQQCSNDMNQLVEAGSVLEDMFASHTYIHTYIHTYTYNILSIDIIIR